LTLFRLLSQVFGALVWLRNRAYDRGWRKIYQAPVPVISVGNLSVGGTGKTPMTEYLIRNWFLAGEGQIAYLSRGYGRQTKGYRLVSPQLDTALSVGDEAMQVALKFPDILVAVCESRRRGIQTLLAQHRIKGIVLDDAFQHRRVHRDLDLLMIDTERPAHLDALLPAGRLREPLSSIDRADWLVFNRIKDASQVPDMKQRYHSYQKPMLFFQTVLEGWVSFGSQQIRPLSQLKGQKAVVFCGVGNPQSFIHQLLGLGVEVVDNVLYRDHHRYSDQDLAKLRAACAPDAVLLTTEKDYCRLQGRVEGEPWYYLPMHLELVDQTEKWVLPN
jgi:tetraacyldisaccharide 4'-kinase